MNRPLALLRTVPMTRPKGAKACVQPRGARKEILVGGRKLAWLLHSHFGVVALDDALAGLGAKHHCAANLTLIPSSELVRQNRTYS